MSLVSGRKEGFYVCVKWERTKRREGRERRTESSLPCSLKQSFTEYLRTDKDDFRNHSREGRLWEDEGWWGRGKVGQVWSKRFP